MGPSSRGVDGCAARHSVASGIFLSCLSFSWESNILKSSISSSRNGSAFILTLPWLVPIDTAFLIDVVTIPLLPRPMVGYMLGFIFVQLLSYIMNIWLLYQPPPKFKIEEVKCVDDHDFHLFIFFLNHPWRPVSVSFYNRMERMSVAMPRHRPSWSCGTLWASCGCHLPTPNACRSKR